MALSVTSSVNVLIVMKLLVSNVWWFGMKKSYGGPVVYRVASLVWLCIQTRNTPSEFELTLTGWLWTFTSFGEGIHRGETYANLRNNSMICVKFSVRTESTWELQAKPSFSESRHDDDDHPAMYLFQRVKRPLPTSARYRRGEGGINGSFAFMSNSAVKLPNGT